MEIRLLPFWKAKPQYLFYQGEKSMLWRCPMLIVKEFSWVYIYTFIYFFFVHFFISNLYTYYFHNITGTMTMELGGKVSIVCSKTGYSCELEFKLRVSCIFGGEIREGVRGVAMVTPILQILFIKIVFKWSVYPKAKFPKCTSSQVLKFPRAQIPKFSGT